MIENLLHAKIVLSKKDVAELRQVGFQYWFGGGRQPFGMITFLGNTSDTAHLLLRFHYEGYGDPWTTLAIQEIFEVEKPSEVYADSTNGEGSEIRVLIITKVSHIMNIRGYIRTKAKLLASATVRNFVNRIRERDKSLPKIN